MTGMPTLLLGNFMTKKLPGVCLGEFQYSFYLDG